VQHTQAVHWHHTLPRAHPNCNTLQRSATHYNTLSETNCNAVQHTLLQHTSSHWHRALPRADQNCNTLQKSGKHCNTLSASHCNAVQHTALRSRSQRCSVLQGVFQYVAITVGSSVTASVAVARRTALQCFAVSHGWCRRGAPRVAVCIRLDWCIAVRCSIVPRVTKVGFSVTISLSVAVVHAAL